MCVLKLKCTKFDFGWGSAASAMHRPRCGSSIAGIRGLLLRELRKDEREGQEGERREV